MLTPRQIVTKLDEFIIGQKEAKKVIAVALRNRYRRMQLEDEMRNEIIPKNILMIGSTGVGKTEIARRLSKLFGLFLSDYILIKFCYYLSWCKHYLSSIE